MNETRVFSLDAEQWQFRCSHHEIQNPANHHSNYHIYFNNQNGKIVNPFIYCDLNKHMIATVIFKVTMRSVSLVENRVIRLAIGNRGIGEGVKMTEYLPVGSDWKTYEVKVQKSMGGPVRVGVYWYDNNPINIALDGMNTTISQKY
ncbi:hypothetical protein [Pelosinus baikalensis]|uniref:Uncharacterized protein n=1 Tax=Pelosinus baikalensis TaxID=2892015 RepID=A0ABS8HZG3_9FIRM|nr:hypothetical protein [Pelosinus baikalensis]MCC5468553.1 hypothetical protein [Pelosinus baikalensis]